MRIKDVCKATGMTDKAVRFYISSGLISPVYTENYSGRKNFSFCEQDIELLNKIALLRKFNFSVNDIKEMLEDNGSITPILENHISDTKNNAQETSMILSNLLNASVHKIECIDDLCSTLSDTIDVQPESIEVDYAEKLKELCKKVKKKIPLILLMIAAAIAVTIAVFVLTTLLFTNIF